MAGPRKLKVYRTAIGFHDAYVAAPSQKAALEAWGSDANLFARGVAELVEDAALTAEPLAHPGTVIKRLRGSAAEQLAALPDAKKTPRKAVGAEIPKVKAKPPSRRAFDAAEAALSQAEADQSTEDSALQREEQALTRRRREMEQAHTQARRRLTEARDQARDDYERAVRNWEA